MIGPTDFASGTNNAFEQVVAEVYAVYQRRLVDANSMDFDDLIARTVDVLRRFPDAKLRYRNRFKHVLIDEYQDTNHAQYALIRELVGNELEGVPPAELCVVGDADQSIYGFRGATIRNILQFEADYPNATTILLEQNYRSTQNILTAANAVISKNESRKRKIFGPKQELVRSLLVTLLKMSMTKLVLSAMKYLDYNAKEFQILVILQFFTELTHNLEYLKKSLCEPPFHIKLLVVCDFMSGKKLRIYWDI